jgi:serine/threonine-protein kinase
MGPNAQGPEGLAGQVVAGYRLERLLGMGATGAVFLGKRLEEIPKILELTGTMPVELPDEAAIKLLILPWQLTPEECETFRSRFVREAETLSALRHPHILSLLTYGEDAATGFTYMLLPLMSGGTLATKIAGLHERLPLDIVTSYLAQVASAPDYAHAQGIVHRDIKPGNVLLDEHGQAFLADFSIVRLLADAAAKLTTTGRVMGTPAYMACSPAHPAADQTPPGPPCGHAFAPPQCARHSPQHFSPRTYSTIMSPCVRLTC